MKKYIINEKEYFIPTSWSDINYNTFIQMKKLEKNSDKIDELEYNKQYISVMTGIPVDVIDEIDLNLLTEILVNIYSFAQKEIPVKSDVVFTFDKQTYVLDKNTSAIILGQFIDLDDMIKNDYWDRADEIAAVLCRKAKKNLFKKGYSIEKYDHLKMKETAKIFREHMPIDEIYSIMVFFLTFVNNFQHFIQTYSQSQIKTKNQKDQNLKLW